MILDLFKIQGLHVNMGFSIDFRIDFELEKGWTSSIGCEPRGWGLGHDPSWTSGWITAALCRSSSGQVLWLANTHCEDSRRGRTAWRIRLRGW
jgi:hypothetical protein